MNISGHIDLCDSNLIEGWLYCPLWDASLLNLQIYTGSEIIGETKANLFRKDLREAGYGDGSCGFSFSIPPNVKRQNFFEVKVRVAGMPIYLLPDRYTLFGHFTPFEPKNVEPVLEKLTNQLQPDKPTSDNQVLSIYPEIAEKVGGNVENKNSFFRLRSRRNLLTK